MRSCCSVSCYEPLPYAKGTPLARAQAPRLAYSRGHTPDLYAGSEAYHTPHRTPRTRAGQNTPPLYREQTHIVSLHVHRPPDESCSDCRPVSPRANALRHLPRRRAGATQRSETNLGRRECGGRLIAPAPHSSHCSGAHFPPHCSGAHPPPCSDPFSHICPPSARW